MDHQWKSSGIGRKKKEEKKRKKLDRGSVCYRFSFGLSRYTIGTVLWCLQKLNLQRCCQIHANCAPAVGSLRPWSHGCHHNVHEDFLWWSVQTPKRCMDTAKVTLPHARISAAMLNAFLLTFTKGRIYLPDLPLNERSHALRETTAKKYSQNSISLVKNILLPPL